MKVTSVVVSLAAVAVAVAADVAVATAVVEADGRAVCQAGLAEPPPGLGNRRSYYERKDYDESLN